ncbi:hypothetical protein D9758_014038 [Tetrapyrgos nigripes]|uniref:DUF6570 domain-containing protein n=1 Tax=Tetrapyrgos nigripes TaxID=182062 RepID=A0A8H5FV43_9AGAR|nr:hypothetical protein D9758_014038 [Tetrapyrgos nigripes]
MTLPHCLSVAANACPLFLVPSLSETLQRLSVVDLLHLHQRVDCNAPAKQSQALRARSIADILAEKLAFAENSSTVSPSVYQYQLKYQTMERELGEGFCHLLGEKILYLMVKPSAVKGFKHWLSTPAAVDVVVRCFDSQSPKFLAELAISIPVATIIKNQATVEYCIQTVGFQGKSSSISVVLSHFFVARLKMLFTLSNEDLAQLFLFYRPERCVSTFEGEDRVSVVREILTGVFGAVVNVIFTESEVYACKKQSSECLVFDQIDLYRPRFLEERERWPEFVPVSTQISCLASYRRKSVYVPPNICAVCACEDTDHSGETIAVSAIPSVELLKCTDPFILTHAPADHFQYLHPCLNGCFFEKKGFVDTDNKPAVYICKRCYSCLCKNSLPPLSLANEFYRGVLPSDLLELNITWAEEMVCALYHTTVLVIRLYGSLDEDQPRVLHGNTSAFELNTVSTARVLPRSPDDLNGMISVVFVGPKKLTLQELRQIKQLYVRKSVVSRLLHYLFRHNRLYKNFSLPSTEILNMYPENDIIPGLEQRIVYDRETSATSVFDQQSSSFSEHPSAQFLESDADQDINGEPFSEHRQAILEHLGVHDPDCT